MALSLLHGGSGFPFLAKSTYDYLCGLPLSSITVTNDEVPNYEARALLDKVCMYVIKLIYFLLLSRLMLQRTVVL